MQCPISKDLWSLFARAASVQGPFVQIKQTLDKWWKIDCVAKLKPLWTFKHMLGVSSIAFCIRNHYGDFIFAETRKVEAIKSILETYNVEIKHIFREGSKLADFLANNVVNFADTNRIFNNLQELPQQEMAIIQLEKSKVPNLRIQKYQNHRVHNMNGG
ncbi:hypothetical protein R3W88_005869 [Solanum pinnatisectum]|uniref:RNase H type-1 domain-containing protein n=1 Tax=Solanum pinnatisectum TaxID=50273 RepID=A0AAV9KD43_9SOLN|nr:hypothetical protein R3W88_005869 [Solanum pinnatisectum]